MLVMDKIGTIVKKDLCDKASVKVMEINHRETPSWIVITGRNAAVFILNRLIANGKSGAASPVGHLVSEEDNEPGSTHIPFLTDWFSE